MSIDRGVVCACSCNYAIQYAMSCNVYGLKETCNMVNIPVRQKDGGLAYAVY